jgi:predicted O-methyltransferase YrrM
MIIINWIKGILAAPTAAWMRRYAFDPRYYELWQNHGYHVTPVDFYSPLPDTRCLAPEIFESEISLCGMKIDLEAQCTLLANFKSDFSGEYEKLEDSPDSGNPCRFFFGNLSFESVDAEILYCMVRNYKPRRVIEIGSGYSTLLTCKALAANSKEGRDGDFTAIEPFPSAFLAESLPYAIKLQTCKVQEVPISAFQELGDGDFLFIDSSHVVKTGSDAHYEFLEILPSLAPGVIVHVHDIFLPREYPRDWVVGRHRAWNEQYILQAFLHGNQDFEVLWSGALMHYRYPEKLSEAFESYDPVKNLPASFWMRRRRS